MKKTLRISIFTLALAGAAAAGLFYGRGLPGPESRMSIPVGQKESPGSQERTRTGHEEPVRGDEQGHEDEHGSERIVRMDSEQMKEFGVELGVAGPVEIKTFIDLPGQVMLNEDRLAHVVPRVPGIARKVLKVLGDQVRKGEVMAVLESRELADAKAEYLAARERISLARANFQREERLWKGKISSEQEFLEAKQAFAETRIALRSAEQKLHALGFSERSLKKLVREPDAAFTRYEIVSPFDGVVIEKHIVLGEVLRDDTSVYVVADMSTVWVDISVYQKDLSLIREGLPVVISAGRGIPDTKGIITYVGPLVGRETRTALARVVLPNPSGQWRPGLFVTARIEAGSVKVPVGVAKEAIQKIEGRPCLFVQEEDGFSPEPVTTGRSNGRYVEIVSGLIQGQKYVRKGAFTLKAQLSRGSFGDGHGH